MVNGEGLCVLDERIKSLDLDLNECYKFLGCEYAERINVVVVY